jgi:hypothetical protein
MEGCLCHGGGDIIITGRGLCQGDSDFVEDMVAMSRRAYIDENRVQYGKCN